MSESAKADIIWLIGFPGVGKTTIGKKISKMLSYNHIDLDSYIERKYKYTIPSFFENFGNEAFRLIENKALGEVCNETNVVISTGGGTPCFYNNIEMMLQTGLVVYLEMVPGMLASRLFKAKKKRPIIGRYKGNELIEKVESLLSERAGYYQKAHLKFNPGKQNLIELVENVKFGIRKSGS